MQRRLIAIVGATATGKTALGIASPSTIFAEIGLHPAAGMEEGVDGGAAGVQKSVEARVALQRSRFAPRALHGRGSFPVSRSAISQPSSVVTLSSR